MANISDFTIDNLGSPDQYTVQTVCKKITVQEKDRTVATLAPFQVFMPAGGATYTSKLLGEEYTLTSPSYFLPGTKPFGMQSVGVASVVFSVREE